MPSSSTPYPTWDAAITIVLLSTCALTAVAFLVRTKFSGRRRHARADKDGGSAVMGKPVVEYAYWLFDPLASGLHALGVSPNGITTFSLVPGFAAGVAVATGYFGLACFLGTAAAFCDAIDGLIARKLGTASDAGEAFDAAVDRYMEFFFQAGLCIHYRAALGPLLLVLATTLAAFMVSYTTAKAESLGIEAPRGAMRRAERSVYMLFGAGITSVWALGAPSGSLWWREAPQLLALTLMAVIGHASVVRRTRVMIARLRARDAGR